jgi:hypothetical protein
VELQRLYLNETEDYRRRALRGELSFRELTNYAKNCNSHADLECFRSLISGAVISPDVEPQSVVVPAFFEGGFTDFGDSALRTLAGENGLSIADGMISTMKTAVYDCHDPSAWRFIRAAADLEQKHDNDWYRSAGEDARAIRDTLGPKEIAQLESGGFSVGAFLLERPIVESKRTRTMYQLKQYVDEHGVRDYYRRLLDDSAMCFGAMTCLANFGNDEDRAIVVDHLPNICIEPNAPSVFTAETINVANVSARCAIALQNRALLQRTVSAIEYPDERAARFIAWCERAFDETSRTD